MQRGCHETWKRNGQLSLGRFRKTWMEEVALKQNLQSTITFMAGRRNRRGKKRTEHCGLGNISNKSMDAWNTWYVCEVSRIWLGWIAGFV